ncbi:MAG: Gfo/Idh/MocA family oxidoreductase, partial [Planctomycetaceae bacterium]|nr:Gfo/Idh/MocA family oxidoreductase [Planctomycetaceae bacterium]
RHMQAIKDTGNTLVAAVDPHDNVGRLDSVFPDTRFFTEIERFDRHLEKLRRQGEDSRVHYVSVCSPNYLHDAHTRLALRVRSHAICEKPLVLSPWNLDALEELEQESGCHVYNVLQLRLLPSLLAIKRSLEQSNSGQQHDVCLTYITRRGRWYDTSWKGSVEKSGGVAMNIGVHFFDLLQWLFGGCEHSEVHHRSSRRMAGFMSLEKARVRWFLSTDYEDLPAECKEKGDFAYRSMLLDGQEIEFSRGFKDLHTQVYEEILAGRGARIGDARPAIHEVHRINQMEVASATGNAHPQLSGASTTTVEAPRRAAA